MNILTQNYIKRKIDDLNFMREKGPFSCGDLILAFQEELIIRISNVERKIRTLNINIESCTKELRTKREPQLTKIEASRLKKKIQNLRDKKQDYEESNFIFHHIGDGLAYLLIDRWDIKPLSFKQSPGFISGKKGARLERKCLRMAFELGGIAILNDITNCLRYGDLTIVSKNRPFMILEVKSGKTNNKRIYRQAADLENITNYLTTDTTNFLYEKPTNAARIEVSIKPTYHVDKFNDFLGFSESSSFHTLEIGHHVIIGKDEEFPLQDSEIHLGERPILFFLNEYRYSNTGYYPLSLIFRNGNHFIDFYMGKMVVGIVIDFALVEQKLESNGLSIEYCKDKDYPYIIRGVPPAVNNDFEFKVSHHFFNRIFFEFLTIDSFCLLLINLINDIPNSAWLPTAR